MSIVTISRGTLSGGRAVAESLAEKLGYACIGHEILQEAAAKLGVSEDTLMNGRFETPPGRWGRVTEERKRYLSAVQSALADECVAGDLVYHGLAGQFLLRDLPFVLRVRLIAPIEMRVRALIAEHHRMGHDAAKEFISHMDQDRRRWVKVIYGADVEDPRLYDLTINLQVISIDTACETIVEAVALPPYEITQEVRERLEAFASNCREQLLQARPRHS